MSDKSNNDNRSNQLNPNNDRYYSSSGVGRHVDDDSDYEYYDNRSVQVRLIEYMNHLTAKEKHRREYETIVSEEFTFDYIFMSGAKTHLKAIAQLPYKNYSDTLINDCIDLIEKGLYPSLRRGCERIADSVIAYSRVRDGKGKELSWMQEEYTPRAIYSHFSHEQKQKIIEQNEIWEQSTKLLVDDFKRALKHDNEFHREDVGFIITPENFRQVSLL